MFGTPGIAGLAAHACFWVLLVYGRAIDRLRWTHIVVFLALWLAARFAFAYAFHPWMAQALTITAVAVLDIALVFMVVRGDVRLTGRL